MVDLGEMLRVLRGPHYSSTRFSTSTYAREPRPQSRVLPP
jgi:hypothetical protein